MNTGGSPSSRPVRSAGTWGTVAISAVGGLLTAVLAIPGAFTLWLGVSVAVGRGDPTWNDGEEVWSTAVGLVLTGLVALVIHLGARTSRARVHPGAHTLITCLWVLPTVAVHVPIVASFVI